MDLKEAFEKNLPLKIIISEGHERVIAEGFIVKDGIVFWDVWWYESSAHPDHFIKGLVSGQGPWKVGDSVVQEMDKQEFLYQADLEPWLRFKEHKDGKEATRKLAEEFTKRNYENVEEKS